MKRILTTLTVCALALVTSLHAQDDPNNPNKKNKHGGQARVGTRPGAGAAKGKKQQQPGGKGNKPADRITPPT